MGPVPGSLPHTTWLEWLKEGNYTEKRMAAAVEKDERSVVVAVVDTNDDKAGLHGSSVGHAEGIGFVGTAADAVPAADRYNLRLVGHGCDGKKRRERRAQNYSE